MERYHAGMLDNDLILAIWHHRGVPRPWWRHPELAVRYMDEVESLVFAEREMPTPVAVRLAMGLRLNYEQPNMPFLAREGCRRVMWSLYMLVTTLAGGYQDFTLCPAETIHIQLPCHDRNFILNLPQVVAKLQPPLDERSKNRSDGRSDGSSEKISPLALTFRVMHLRHRILQFTKRAAAIPDVHLASRVQLLQSDLDSFVSQLPLSFSLSETNIRLHAYTTTLTTFATVHITLYGTHCILYRLAIQGLQELLPARVLDSLDAHFVADYRRRCAESAQGMTDLIQNLLSLHPSNLIMDVDDAAIVYQGIRILSHLSKYAPLSRSDGDFLARTTYCLEFIGSTCINCEAERCIKRDTETARRKPLFASSADVSALAKAV
ncbi:hypothetical protein SEUCBS139899_005829 [Sporothrix eucalyptigena]|uniref:Transcription factor domain-containing protein n=1 Tax=Sporothrix eucalyptigena TaxID=1812306 RepID=A0ABP0BNT5_9PEZI